MRFRFHSSRRLLLLLTLAHGAAAFSALYVPMPGVRWVLLFVLLANLGYRIWREWRSPEAVATLLIKEQQVWLELRNGAQAQVDLCSGTVTPWLVVLRFRDKELRCSWNVVVLPDSLERESFRRLRVWLKWKLSDLGSSGA